RQKADSIANASGVYFEFQVEEPVTHISGGAPIYPADLRAAGVSGQVIAQFVVNTDGLVDTNTFKVLQASDDRFVAAVREALPGMRFEPAKAGGRTVRQLVQQPFVFEIR
ncbi:MAG TPA: energy transducer TonB, partial [Gemmatimonadaceae bacterium]|nr:energy transducer TonB [Gemmatimonadaceae bacterium]